MIIAQKTYKHKVLLLMKVGLAVFMVVIFLAQNAGTGAYEAKNFVYKKLNTNETQYFLNNLSALPSGAGSEIEAGVVSGLNGIDLEVLSAQIAEQIKTSVEPLLLQEASAIKVISPSFDTHQSSLNILMYSVIFGLLAILFIENQKLIFKNSQFLKLKKVLASISPRSPNFTI